MRTDQFACIKAKADQDGEAYWMTVHMKSGKVWSGAIHNPISGLLPIDVQEPLPNPPTLANPKTHCTATHYLDIGEIESVSIDFS